VTMSILQKGLIDNNTKKQLGSLVLGFEM